MIFKVNGGFPNTNRDFLVKWGICEEKTRDFRLNGGFEKTRDFRLNGGFANTNRDFLVKWGICEEKMRDFCLNGEIGRASCRERV